MSIFYAETVILKFGPQKSGTYNDEIPLDNNNDVELNPITLWANIITRLRSYPKYNAKWPVYTCYDKLSRRFEAIKSREIELDIKAAVAAIGKDTLGFGPEEVGTHSVRSSLAMQLYLQQVPPYTIMLIGRWRSDAFLSYIEKQCREFTKGMSTIMLKLNSFYHLPRQPRAPQENPTSHPSCTHRQAHFVHFGRLQALNSHRRN